MKSVENGVVSIVSSKVSEPFAESYKGCFSRDEKRAFFTML